MNRMTRVFEAAITWHASTILSGERQTQADRYLHRAVSKYLKSRSERDRLRRAKSRSR